MSASRVQNVVVVGGGTAGWTAAAAVAKLIGANLNVVLVESDAIGTVGVGEATIPPFRTMHRLLKVNDADFLAGVRISEVVDEERQAMLPPVAERRDVPVSISGDRRTQRDKERDDQEGAPQQDRAVAKARLIVLPG